MFLLLLLTLAAADQPYFRFWSGYRLSNLTHGQFKTGMQWFLNQTTHISNCGGLRLYVVPLIDTSGLPSYVPDEIALLFYQSADEYHSFYSTPIGKFYQNLHARFFNMSRSASLVPQDFDANGLQFNHAYCYPNCEYAVLFCLLLLGFRVFSFNLQNSQSWTDLYAATSTVYNDNSFNLDELDDLVEYEVDNTGAKAVVFGIYQQYLKFVYFFKTPQLRDAAKSLVATLNGQVGQAVGPMYQVAENVVPPLTLQFGHTVNVTIGPCTLNH